MEVRKIMTKTKRERNTKEYMKAYLGIYVLA